MTVYLGRLPLGPVRLDAPGSIQVFSASGRFSARLAFLCPGENASSFRAGFDEQKPVGAILKWNGCTSGLSPSLHPGNKAGQLQIIQQGL